MPRKFHLCIFMSMNQNLIRAALVVNGCGSPSSAQFIMGNETVETCAGIFVDTGNSDDRTATYPDANFTYTICRTIRDAVSVSFVAFGLQTNEPEQQRLCSSTTVRMPGPPR